MDKLMSGEVICHYFSKEELLRNEQACENIENTIKKSIVETKDKKDMCKAIAKNYIKYAQKLENAVFDALMTNFNCDALEKVALLAKYKKDITPGEFVKKIKKFNEINLYELVIREHSANFLLFYAVGLINGYDINGEVKDDDYKKLQFILKESMLYYLTIKVIKDIRYGCCVYDIASFDKNDNPKKVFVNKVLTTYKNKYYTVDKKYLSTQKVVEQISARFLEKGESVTPEDMEAHTIEYLRWLEYNLHMAHNEYPKLILDESYNTYVSNEVNDLTALRKIIVDLNIFLKRKVLMPKSGVLLLIEENDTIESILLKEVFKYDINHFVVIAKYKDGKEIANVYSLESKEDTEDLGICYEKENGNTVLDYVEDFLKDEKGVKDKTLKYEAIAPQYWKYRNRGYKSENDKLNVNGFVVKREFEIEIAPFIRKTTGEASNEARKLADKLGVELEDGYTIVKPHIRIYNKIK